MTDKARATYGLVSRLNHWITALFFLAMLGVGFVLAYGELTRDERVPLMLWHKATGILLLVFALWRIVWRLVQGFPAPVPGMGGLQLTFSKLTHWGLLACLLLMPLSGFVMAHFGGRPTDMYGLFTLPAFADSEGVRTLMRAVHKWVAYGFVVFIGLHIAGALKHLLIDRDGTVSRMVTGKPAGV